MFESVVSIDGWPAAAESSNTMLELTQGAWRRAARALHTQSTPAEATTCAHTQARRLLGGRLQRCPELCVADERHVDRVRPAGLDLRQQELRLRRDAAHMVPVLGRHPEELVAGARKVALAEDLRAAAFMKTRTF